MARIAPVNRIRLSPLTVAGSVASLITGTGDIDLGQVSISAVASGGGGGDSFAHGDSVEITGSGFGSSPTFTFTGGANGPFETVSNAQSPAAKSGWNWSRFGAPWKVITDGTRGKCVGQQMVEDTIFNWSSEYTLPSSVPEGGKLYITYWAKSSNDIGSGQWKMLRIQQASDIADDGQTTYLKLFGSNDFVELSGSQNFYGDSGDGYIDANNTWMRVEIKLTAGTQGNRNGSIRYRVFRGSSVPSDSGVDMESAPGNYDIRTQHYSYNNSGRYSSLLWQNYCGNGAGSPYFSIDDQYVQVGSFKRVELWNALSKASATLREIQEITSWSGSAVTVRLNKGGLSAGTYYLVVLDDNYVDTVLASRQIEVT